MSSTRTGQNLDSQQPPKRRCADDPPRQNGSDPALHRGAGGGRIGGQKGRKNACRMAPRYRLAGGAAASSRPGRTDLGRAFGHPFHAPELLSFDGPGGAEGKALLPETVLKIRDKADALKLQIARKMLQDFFSQEGQNGGKS